MQLRIKYKSQCDEFERVISVPYDPSIVHTLMIKYAQNYPHCDIYLTQYGIQMAYAKWIERCSKHDIVVCMDMRRATEIIKAILGKMPEKRHKEALAAEPDARASLFVEMP